MAHGRTKHTVLNVLEILQNKTDIDHPLNASEIMDQLERFYDTRCDRRSIYSDITALQEAGFEIEMKKGGSTGYYLKSRQFELPELKLLVDAVQVSKFITARKSEELIGKLEGLTSHDKARQLHRQVYIYDRPKAMNETVFGAIDRIHEAISSNLQIRFQYAEWTVQKKYRLRHNGQIYQVSPWSLIWADENYYLIAYDHLASKIKFYRVDKMVDVKVSSEAREGRDEFEKISIANFEKKTFGMYGGKDVTVTLRCPNSLVNVIIDRFGTDLMLVPEPNDCFHVSLPITLSRQFFGWVTAIGPEMEIIRPAEVRDQYAAYIQEISEQYSKKKQQE